MEFTSQFHVLCVTYNNKQTTTMALEIRPTPTLSGDVASKFEEEVLRNVENKIDISDMVEKTMSILAKAEI